MPFPADTPAGPVPAGYPGVPLLIAVTADSNRVEITFGSVVPTGATQADYLLPADYVSPFTANTELADGSQISFEMSPGQSRFVSLPDSAEAAGVAEYRIRSVAYPPDPSLHTEFTLGIRFTDFLALGVVQYRIITESAFGAAVYNASRDGGPARGSASVVVLPELVAATGLEISENAAIGTVVGVAATPRNFAAGTPAWRFGNGTNSSPPFGITAATGELTVIGALNFDTQSVYTRTIVLTQAGGTAQVDVQITVLEFFPPSMPATLTPAELSVVEGAAVGTTVGIAATATNFPAAASSWRIINAAGDAVILDGLWAIDGVTGSLMVAATIPPRADAASYMVRVRLTQGGSTAEAVVTISVTAAPPVIPDPVAERPRHFAAWTVVFPDVAAEEGGDAATDPLRFWTGDGPLVLAGETYAGVGAMVSVGQLNAELSQPVRQATIGISLRPLAPDRRAIFLGDPGSQRVEIGQVVSDDGGTWRRIPRTFRGRLSAPRLGDDIYQIDVVTTIADIDRGRPQFLSHEQQTERHPGDLGLEYMRELAGGIDIRWPP